MAEVNSKIEVVDNGEQIASVEGVPPIATATIARTIVFAIVWVNQLFAFIGLPVLDIDTEVTYAAISTVITLGVSIWTAWKDNSFTIAARIGDMVMKAIKKTDDATVGSHAKVK